MKKENKLISEDLKKFRLLSEYDFYIGEEEEVMEPEGEIITEEPPEDGMPDEGEPKEDNADGELEGGDEGMEEEMPDDGIPDGELEGGESFGEELPEPEEMDDSGESFGEEVPELAPEEPMEDEVEIDVTELVQSTEEAKASAEAAADNVNQLISKMDELGQSLDKMDVMNAKIDDLENELEKRNPTPDEQLEMRSLDSFPYNLKLTDYWSEKEGQYDVMNTERDENEEYSLTQDEVERDYNEIHVKDSFSESDPFDEDEDDFNEKIRY